MSTATKSTLASFQSYVEELSHEKLLLAVKLRLARTKIEELQEIITKKDEEIERLTKAIDLLQ